MIETIIREFGPIAGAIAFFLWRDWKREERYLTLNESLNTFIRGKFTATLDENTEVIHKSNELMSEAIQISRQNNAVIEHNNTVIADMIAHCKAET